jgi:hypothetical protein
MIKPECFRVGYIASCNMPYGFDETSRPEMLSSGGVLRKGQPVWLKESLTGKPINTFVPAYVEHLGVVSLDARLLVDFAILPNHVGKAIGPRRITTMSTLLVEPRDPRERFAKPPFPQGTCNHAGGRSPLFWRKHPVRAPHSTRRTGVHFRISGL